MFWDPISAPAALTVARARGGKVLAKRHSRDARHWQSTSYAQAYLYDLARVEPASVPALHQLLQELKEDRYACLLLGLPAGGVESLQNVRRVLYQQKDGTQPSLEDCGTRWLVFDIDEGLPLRSFPNPTDLRGVATKVRQELLPPIFRNVACVAQFTGSHMVKTGSVRLRLIFLADRPQSMTAALNAMTDDADGRLQVDPSTMRPAQPIYTAAPIFEGGDDPVPERLVLLDGSPTVTMPSDIVAQMFESERVELAQVDLDAAALVETPDWLHPRVGRWLDRIGDHQHGEGLHVPALKACASFANFHGRERGPEFLQLVAAIARRRCPKRPRAELREELRRIGGQLRWTFDRHDAPTVTVPPFEIPHLTADEAARELESALLRWLTAVEEDAAQEATEPRYGLIAASLGLGKTRLLVNHLTRVLQNDPTLRILVRVPDHRLGAQIMEAVDQHDDELAGVWLGAGQELEDGRTMCLRFDDMREVVKAGGSMENACRCGKTHCEHHPSREGVADPCQYKAQYLRERQLVIVAGDVSLTRAMPARIKREGAFLADFNALILDETAPEDAVSEDRLLRLSALDAPLPAMAEKAGAKRHHLPKITDEVDWRTALSAARKACEAALTRDGVLRVSDLKNAGLGVEQIDEARPLIWRYKVGIANGDQTATLRGDELREKLKLKAAVNSKVQQLTGFLAALKQGLQDGAKRGDADHRLAQITLLERSDGVQAAYFRRRQELHVDFREISTLVLDATPELELLRSVFPQLAMLGDFRAKDGPGVTRLQVKDWRGSARQHDPSHDYAADYAEDLLRAFFVIAQLAKIATGSVGLIGRKDGNQWAAENLPELVEGVQLGHFGAVRGLNDWEDVGAHIVLGRLLPKIGDVERTASVLLGQPVVRAPYAPGRGVQHWDRVPAAAVLRGGSGAGLLQREAHADQLVEAVRRAMCENELEQVRGRVREVRRGADRPVWQLIGTATPISAPIDHLISIEDVKAAGGLLGLQLVAGFWVPKGSSGSSWLVLNSRNSQLENFNKRNARIQQSDRWYRDHLRTGPQLELEQRITAAFFAAEPAEILPGLLFPSEDFHELQVRAPGVKQAARAWVRAGDQAEPENLREIAAAIWPSAAEIIPKPKRRQ